MTLDRLELKVLLMSAFPKGMLVLNEGWHNDTPAEDDAPPMPAIPVRSVGDLWLCGTHRVLCEESDHLSAHSVRKINTLKKLARILKAFEREEAKRVPEPLHPHPFLDIRRLDHSNPMAGPSIRAPAGALVPVAR
jgi:hypothetical protein